MKNLTASHLLVALMALVLVLGACQASQNDQSGTTVVEPASDLPIDEVAMAADMAADAAADVAARPSAEIPSSMPDSASPNITASGSAGTDVQFGSVKYCGQLAHIGSNVFDAKQEGHPMATALAVVKNGLAHDQQKQMAAEGVVIAIYGDDSIGSSTEAYNIVLAACER